MEGCIKGCLGIIILGVALHFIIQIGGCVYDEIKEKADKATAWRDERLAKRAQEEEFKRKQQAAIAQEEEAKRKRVAAAAEAKRQQEAAAAEAGRKQRSKADKIQTFALKDAPKVWAVYQSLKSEIDTQNGKIEELRKTLVAFGRAPEEDEDFERICAQRDEMIRSQKALYGKLEDAYIAACKFAATPGRKEYEAVHRKALEDGIREAEAAEAKFKEMRLSK